MKEKEKVILGNKTLLTVLDDNVWINELIERSAFDSGDHEWWVVSKMNDLVEAIKERVAELDQVHGVKTDGKCSDGKCPTLNLKTCDECGCEMVLVYVKNHGKMLVHKEKTID